MKKDNQNDVSVCVDINFSTFLDFIKNKKNRSFERLERIDFHLKVGSTFVFDPSTVSWCETQQNVVNKI